LTAALSESVSTAVRRLARRERTSPYVVLLTAFAAHVSAVARRDEVVVGIPVANRVLPRHEGVVGPFVNTLPLRLGGPADFTALVRRTRDVVVEALEHQHVPFAKIIAALGLARSQSPLVQVLCTGRPPVRPPVRLGDATVKWAVDPPELGVAIMDLELAVLDDGARITGELTYATDIFDTATAQDILDGWTDRLAWALSPTARPSPSTADSHGGRVHGIHAGFADGAAVAVEQHDSEAGRPGDGEDQAGESGGR
jgi:non-ribosomal peptide synthetase component F